MRRKRIAGIARDTLNFILEASRSTAPSEFAGLLQADGEIIGTTPLCIRVLPQAVSLIVPVIHGIYIPIDYVNKYILGL